MKIAKILPSSDQLPYTYYKEFSAAFIENLRKKGDVVKHQGDKVLQSDEEMSPTFEDSIVLWALANIDNRLPNKVERDFGHLMTKHVTLKDLQNEIFQKIPLHSVIPCSEDSQVYTRLYTLQRRVPSSKCFG